MTTIAAFAVILAGGAAAQQPVFPAGGQQQKLLTPAEMAARSSAQVEKAYSDTMAALAKTERCFAAEAEMTADLAKKKKELSAEFGAKIPDAFAELQFTRAKRINRQHAECVNSHAETSRLLGEAFVMLRTSVPISPNYKAQKAKLDAANEKIRKLLPGGPARQGKAPAAAAKKGGGEGSEAE